MVAGEARLPRLVKVALEPGRFQVVSARTREEALDILAVQEPALVVVEMEQADGDGVAVCRSLRELSDVPVIFLAAADDDATKVRALRCADDYVTRPFSVVELLARVEAILRRARPCLSPRETAYDDGLLAVDLAAHQVTFGGVAVTLTPTELKLLALLVENRTGCSSTRRSCRGSGAKPTGTTTTSSGSTSPTSARRSSRTLPIRVTSRPTAASATSSRPTYMRVPRQLPAEPHGSPRASTPARTPPVDILWTRTHLG